MHPRKIPDQFHPYGCPKVFRNEVQVFADAFEIEERLRTRLYESCEHTSWMYLSDLKDHQDSPTVAQLLEELHSLKNAMEQGGRLRGKGDLMDETVSALVGDYPASAFEFVDLRGTGRHIPVVGTLPFMAKAIKHVNSMFKSLNIGNQFGVIRYAPESSKALAKLGFPISKNASLPTISWDLLRETLKGELRADFKSVVVLAIHRVEVTFGLENGRKPGRITVDRGVSPRPERTLVNSVYALLVDLKMCGKLTWVSADPIRNLIQAMISYALGEYQCALNPPSYSEMISDLFTINRQIRILNDSVLDLEGQIFHLDRGDVRKEKGTEWCFASQTQLYTQFFLLRDWRRELERRRDLGDFRSVNAEYLRINQGELGLPNWPSLVDIWPLQKKNNSLIEAACDFQIKRIQNELNQLRKSS